MKVAVKNISNNITQDEMDAGRLQSVFDITVEDGSKFPFQIHSVNLCEKTLSVMRLHPAEQTVDKPTVLADTLESAGLCPV